MVRVAPINLAYNPRTLWFDPGDLEIAKGDPVVVETARGTEFGTAANDIIEVDEEEIKSLKSPLKPVLRIASDEDVERARELEQKSREALPVFKEMAAESHPDMHPVSVEFLLDGDKAVFYFEAEERIDFRELVRRLASHFKARIDMRQIGVRDEARIVGGLGHCGQELCCKRMGGEFCPVSIRMAKEQDLSLNPQKISGLCGRLMCCLRYEYDAYKDFKSRAPKVNATIQTPAGSAKVVELDVPREIVSLKVGDEKPVKVPLADFDEAPEGGRPTSVGEEAWEFATSEAASGYKGDPITFLTSQFTGSDKLAEKGSVRRNPSSRSKRSQEPVKFGNPRGGRGGKGSRAERGGANAAAVVDETRKPRRRRSTKLNAGDAPAAEAAQRATRGAESEATAAPAAGRTRRSRNRTHQAEGRPQQAGERRAEHSEQPKQTEKRSQSRFSKADGQAEKRSSSQRGEKRSQQPAKKRDGGKKDAAVRPGQKSSGVRNAASQPHEGGADNAKPKGEQAQSQHRRPRRRRGKSGNGGNGGNSSSAANQGGAE